MLLFIKNPECVCSKAIKLHLPKTKKQIKITLSAGFNTGSFLVPSLLSSV